MLHPRRLSLLLHLARAGGRAQSPDLRNGVGIKHRADFAIHRKKLSEAELIIVDGQEIGLTNKGAHALAVMAETINSAIGGRKIL